MSLHHGPETPPKSAAEELALHLETNYGLQLDPVRHAQLLKELDEHLDRARIPVQAEGA
jgi:hypothetical protein